MRLDVRELARLFEVNERTVHRWIAEDGLPAYHVEGESRFHRAEVLEWAIARDITLSPSIFEGEALSPETSIVHALERGGIHLGISTETREAVFAAMVDRLPIEPIDRGPLLEVLSARPDFGRTGLAMGVAVPHVRHPIVLEVSHPVITLSILDRSLPNRAGDDDGPSINAIFTLVTPSLHAHLVVHSRLAYAVHMVEVRRALAELAPTAILQALRNHERHSNIVAAGVRSTPPPLPSF